MIFENIPVKSSGAEINVKAYCPDVMSCDTQPDGRISVVICPGGGYDHLAERESEPIALVFAAMGFNAFVVEYRVRPSRFPAQIQDAASAVAYVRKNAKRFHSNPDKIAVAGFSAGGHLAASLGTMWEREELWNGLGLTPDDVKPNAMVLCYPVIASGKYSHGGTFVSLTGSEDPKDHEPYSLQNLVTKSTPPAFIWHTREDNAVPVQNSLLFAMTLSDAGIHNELHIFPHGPHGLALANEITSLSMPERILPDVAKWPQMAAKFLTETL